MTWNRWCLALAMLLLPGAAAAQPYAFVSNAADESVAVVDLASDTVVATLPLSGRPTGAALSRDGRRLFVARTQADSLAMIDTATGAVASIAVGAAPSAVAVAPGRRRAYVANTGGDSLSVINTATGAVVATIAVGSAPAGVIAGGRRVFVANWGGNSVSVVDAITHAVVAAVPVGVFPAALALHRGRLYVANFGDDTVSVIDTATLSRIATVPVSRRPRGLALDPATGRLYVASFEDARIDVINTATNTVVLQAPSGGLNPTDLMLGPGGARLYVAHLEAAQPLRVLNAATLAPLAVIDAPAGPVSLAGYGPQAPPASAGDSRLQSAIDAVLSLRELPSAVPHRAAGLATAPDDVEIFDGEFNANDWQVLIAHGTSTTTRETVGGNPGAWRNTIHTAGPQAVETWHQFLGARYEPGIQGAIGAVDASWHRKVAGETPVSESVLIVQDGHLYRTTVQQFSQQTWTSVARLQLTQADFSDGNADHPDFSAAGAPLFFGYYRWTPQGGTGGHGIDNFRVTIHPAAGPGAIAFQKSVLLIEADTAIVTVERLGGLQGAVGATVRVAHPTGSITDHLVQWSDGDGARKDVGVQLSLRQDGGAQTARVSLAVPTGGATIAGGRDGMVIVHAPMGWPAEMLAMFLSFQVLLAAASPGWVLALAGPAILLAARRRRGREPHRRSGSGRTRTRVVRLLLGVGAVAALAVNAGCAGGEPLEYASVGFNTKLRPDRKPLDAAQLQTAPNLLRFGPYRVGLDELATPIAPADDKAGRIRQSDCWWMAQGPQGGGDAVLARWELVAELRGHSAELWNDPEDGLAELGICRLNDPETRNPPQSREGEDPSVDLDCGSMSGGPATALPIGISADFPRCTTDAVLLFARLDAYGTTVSDVHRRCDVLRGTFTRLDRVVGQTTDSFNGPSAGSGDQTRVSVCAAATGNTLIPATPTRYLLSAQSVTQWLDPVLLPASAGAVLGRRMAQDTADWIWWTLETYDPAGSGERRWQENFSPSLRVRTVTLFEMGAGGKTYVNASPRPTLCIEDRDTGSGCRWTCDANPNENHLRYDLLTPRQCRNRQGQDEIPSVNPAAAPVNLAQIAQRLPLIWRVNRGGLPQPDLWVEFTLATTIAPAALTASPGFIDLGGARVGGAARGAFVVRNSGEHPMRITAVAMAPAGAGSPHSADFVPQLPFAPARVPFPVEFVSTSKETVINVRPDAERETLHRLYQDSVVAVLAPRGQGFSETIDGHVVTEQDGLLTRDAINAHFNHDVARQPAARVTYAFRTLPFVVQPGESFEVSLRGRPSATGDRRAEVRISSQSVIDPARRADISVLAKVFGMQGPLLSALPGLVSVSVQGAGQARLNTLMVQNAGDVAGVLGRPLLSGLGGAALPANSPFSLEDPYASWSTLGVDEYREVRVHFLSACGATHGFRNDSAEVRWSTADGPIVVPVHGTTSCP